MSMSDYERYQLEWMIEHGHSLKEVIEGISEIDPDGLDSLEDRFALWEADRGFNGELWASMGEWEEGLDANGAKVTAPDLGYEPNMVACSTEDVLTLYDGYGISSEEAQEIARETNETLIINFIRTPSTFIRTCADECGNPIP